MRGGVIIMMMMMMVDGAPLIIIMIIIFIRRVGCRHMGSKWSCYLLRSTVLRSTTYRYYLPITNWLGPFYLAVGVELSFLVVVVVVVVCDFWNSPSFLIY